MSDLRRERLDFQNQQNEFVEVEMKGLEEKKIHQSIVNANRKVAQELEKGIGSRFKVEQTFDPMTGLPIDNSKLLLVALAFYLFK